jgi:hypothetical protein
MDASGRPREEGEFRPPTGSWPRLYALVVAVLVVEVMLLWVLSRAFP